MSRNQGTKPVSKYTSDNTLTEPLDLISDKTAKGTLIGDEELLINDGGDPKKTTAQAIADLVTSLGDVVGPDGSTNNAIARFDSTTGKIIKNSQVTISDSGDIDDINSLSFDTSSPPTLTSQGQMAWNSDEETVDIQLNGFRLHVGEHVVYHVKNETGSTIAKGVPVMFAGTNGSSGKLLIQPWNGTGPSIYFLGLTAEEFINDAEGFVIEFGKLRGIQTNGGNYGETWISGDIIYADDSAGSLTKVAPLAPKPHITICAVVNAHSSNGTLFIRPSLGSNIKNDEGVTITSLDSAQILISNIEGTVFENKSISGDATLASDGSLTLNDTAVTPGSYINTSITVDSKGRITEINNGSSSIPDPTSEPDGRILETQSGVLIYANKPSGGESSPLSIISSIWS